MIDIWTISHIMQLLLSLSVAIVVFHLVFVTSTRYPMDSGRYVAAVLLSLSAGLGMYVMLDYLVWVAR